MISSAYTTRCAKMTFILAICSCLINCSSGSSQDEQTTAQQAQLNQKQEDTEQEPVAMAHVQQRKREMSQAEMMYGVAPAYLASVPAEPLFQPQPKYDDKFSEFNTNPVKQVAEHPVSTFSADVDTASYSFVRKRLNSGYLPDKDAVRLEEMVNYFDYNYPMPDSAAEPFKASVVVHDSPWAAHRKLIHIGIQGYELPVVEQPDSNLVFLLDVSGSMNATDKLPLVKQSVKLLLNTLKPTDTIAIVVYAGAAGTVLEPTRVSESATILAALNNLQAGGSTAGGQGLQLAYQLAEQHFNQAGVNRVLLATDGDFNVGISDPDSLAEFVERKRDSGIFLSVIGFGRGNYNDHLMQSLAQNGNGIAAYIDTLSEAQKVFVEEATSSLFPIANDLKIQVEFNPQVVREYRLLGYETRALKEEDFSNDNVDAGDIGSGHSVTAIYEITLQGEPGAFLEPRRYTQPQVANSKAEGELGYLKIRYKLPEQQQSQLLEQPIAMNANSVSEALLEEAKFAAAVAGFSQLIKDAKYTGDWRIDDAFNLALANKGEDYFGYRSEFTQLIRQAKSAEPTDF
ncbi:MAG: VWA domain-containing protein [Alteromonadaceae bacterium]|nr:VWA domain-containing protein [Alteromonadaceae bacterium]